MAEQGYYASQAQILALRDYIRDLEAQLARVVDSIEQARNEYSDIPQPYNTGWHDAIRCINKATQEGK